MNNEQLAISNFKRKTSKRSLLTAHCSLLIIFFSFFLLSMNWPSEDAVLIRNFGANDNGKPVLGMIFYGGTAVQAAEAGEVIFTSSRENTASRLPSPLGAWTAIDHGDGLISIYSRYADPADISADVSAISAVIFESDSDEAINEITEEDFAYKPEQEYFFSDVTHVEKFHQIAYPGISGWSSRDGFLFMIIDRRERRWINPAMIITPQLRTRNPQILSVELRDEQGVTIQGRNINQGRYSVLVNTISLPEVAGASGINMIPQRITCLINGAETASLTFESFSARDGFLMVYRNGLVPARQIYSGFPSFEASEVFFTRGQATLEIIVQDLAGNTSGSVMRLTVN